MSASVEGSDVEAWECFVGFDVEALGIGERLLSREASPEFVRVDAETFCGFRLSRVLWCSRDEQRQRAFSALTLGSGTKI